VGSYISIGPGIEEDEPSLCGGAPWGRDPTQVVYLNVWTLRTRIPKLVIMSLSANIYLNVLGNNCVRMYL
jgi:hypothetical protein